MLASAHRVVQPARVLLALTFLAWAFLALTAAAGHGQEPSETIDGHPALADAPRHTTTKGGRQGDPVNIGFIGTDEELHRALAAAGCYAADPITLESSVRIAADVVLKKPYPHAPVSDLYLWGRRQDLAYERLVIRVLLSPGPQQAVPATHVLPLRRGGFLACARSLSESGGFAFLS